MIHIGDYSELNINRTKKNLEEFRNCLVFHQGYIPETLHTSPEAPASVDYMHIDINSVIPTQKTLEFFWPRLSKGGVILFDYYGWTGYEEMKDMIDGFFADKPGMLLKLPTGQAVYFHL